MRVGAWATGSLPTIPERRCCIAPDTGGVVFDSHIGILRKITSFRAPDAFGSAR